MLSLKLYKLAQPSASTDTTPTDKEDSKPAAKSTQVPGDATSASAASAETGAAAANEEGVHDPFEGLDETTKTCFEVCRNNGI